MPQILSAQKKSLPSSRTRHLLFQRLGAFWHGCLSAGGARGWHTAPQGSSSFLNSLTLENKMQTCFLVLLLFSGTLPHLQFHFSSFDSSWSPGCAITSMPPPLPWAPQVLPMSPERLASARLMFPRAVPRGNRISSPELAGKGRQVLPPDLQSDRPAMWVPQGAGRAGCWPGSSGPSAQPQEQTLCLDFRAKPVC